MSQPPLPALYRTRVDHTRHQPFRHSFSYRVFSVLLDIDALDRLPTRLLRYNRPGVLSFRDSDHGDGSGAPLRGWVEAQLAAGGLAHGGAHIRLLCFPRLWGYTFNPLAIYYCYDAAGALVATLHQVSNTFGERHSYLLPAGSDTPVRQACAKAFHVSPFFPVSGGYRFTLLPPGERLDVAIRYLDAAGTDLLFARQHGTRAPLSDRALAGALLAHPLMTLKVMAGIHWEALKLWRKGARYHRKPAPPLAPVTLPASMSGIGEDRRVAAHGR